LDMHGFQVLWLHELLRAAVNTVAAIPIFLLLDHTKIRE
jgi:rod shape-determining protein MreD